MITLAVLDTDQGRLTRIREALASYSIRRNMELQVYWYTSQKSFEQLERWIASVCVALIAVGDIGRKLGRKVYALNPDCRIIFYGSEGERLRSLLRARPIGYHVVSDGAAVLAENLDEVLQEIADSSAFYRFESRRRTLLLPAKNILYFQSDLKSVHIHLKNGQVETVTAKLSNVEQQLGDFFVRVHQSFLVNASHIRVFDRSRRVVFISNGQELPISDAKYESASARLEQLMQRSDPHSETK